MEVQAVTGVVSKGSDEVREMSRYASLLESELTDAHRRESAARAVAAGILERVQREDRTHLTIEGAASELLADLEIKHWDDMDQRTRLLWENLSRALAGMGTAP